MGILAGATGDHARAAKLIAFGIAQGRYGTLLYPADEAAAEAALQAARGALGESAFDRAWAEGQAMSLDGALEGALPA